MTDENHIYKPLETKNILSNLVDNIINDEVFQKHVNILQTSESENDQKNAFSIKSTISNIRVFNTNVHPLFLAKDIGILMGISNIKYFTRQFEPEEKVIGYTTINNKMKKVIFLTRLGIYRCFYASRSPLAKLFRKFISNLLDHMITHENELLQRISCIFRNENPGLIDRGMADLASKLIEYETKYAEEQKKAEQLEQQCDEEIKKRFDAEKEVVEIDIINSYNMMQIEQLKKEKDSYISRIKTIQNTIEPETIDNIEIRMLKEMFMKPVYLCILHPNYFTKLLKPQPQPIMQSQPQPVMQSQPQPVMQSQPQPNLPNLHYDSDVDTITVGKISDLDMKVYKRNFENIFTEIDKVKVEKDEILYYCLSFSRNAAKNGKLIHVSTQYVVNKNHYTKTLTSLSENSEVIELNKIVLYKTSIEEISDIIREEFIKLT